MKNLILVALITFVNLFSAQTSTKAKVHCNLKNGLAIQGYDPVAYFSNQAIKGDKTISATHNGVTYYFSNETNKNAFLKNPYNYEPQYGG